MTPLERGHARVLSSRAVAAVSRFPCSGSRDLWLSLEAFPRGFPTRLSHRAVPRDPVVGVDPRCESEAVQGKQVPLEWAEISGGLLDWCHLAGVPLVFPVESASSLHATGMPRILFQQSRERIPHLEVGGENGAPLNVGGPVVLRVEWRRVCRGSS